MKPYRRTALGALAAVAFLAAAGLAPAQSFPSRPMKLVVPFPPGGSADTAARIIGDKISEEWKQPVLVENKPGAGTTIGSAFVAGSPADGYVLYLTGLTTHVSSGIIFKNLSYDAVKSFAAVGQVSAAPFVLVVNPSLKVETVKALVELAKGKPGELTYGSSGSGGGTHLAMEMLADAAGIKLVHVPFKGTAPAVASLLGGHVNMLMADVSVAPQIRSGKLRGLAVTTAKPSRLVPGVPTLVEAGVAGFEAPSIIGILAPGGTPREVVVKINAAMNRALAAEDVRQRLYSQGFEPAPGTPEEFGAVSSGKSG
ncbi:MAG: tripartite tricarboxylate transporter substrate binding protein [Betaproteobacteria bacterium]|nr:tripartite tricarboxylate transporter substrate binding protein [Betaproteobacteria bacterium]